jgi:hypothetical protein
MSGDLEVRSLLFLVRVAGVVSQKLRRDMKNAIAKLRCFLSKHDLIVYRIPSLRLHCRRCGDPWSDTLRDKWQRQRKQPKVQPTDDGLPF